ncbi:DeoR/GlpR family DNA-binding transcription regulator [Virgibacillus halophilus]|uniref:DeoR/GlpR family DNA-binding transcription regulator n=1 Tax=Tigheibacillus halophilus TaxID=361280 RepID=UPI0036299A51
MLTEERYNLILHTLKEKETISIQHIISKTGASESTIRRDLNDLEVQGKLKRIHGGARKIESMYDESSIIEKTTKNLHEKQRIAAYAASLIHEGECIFLDAGTTVLQMIPFLENKNVYVVTNGLTHIDLLDQHGIKTYLTGGMMKTRTSALIGTQTIESLENYRFDKCFLGTNGFDPTSGYTTPDPEEAAVKKKALQLAKGRYVVADHEKYKRATFSKIAALSEAVLITSQMKEEDLAVLEQHTEVRSC